MNTMSIFPFILRAFYLLMVDNSGIIITLLLHHIIFFQNSRFYRSELKSPKSWFETLISCALLQYGGITLTGLFLGHPPPWMMDAPPFTGFLISWWLIFFCPNDLYWKFISFPSVLMLYSLVGVFNNGHAITSWGVDYGLHNSFHSNPRDISKSWIICIVSGILSFSGGTVLCDWLGLMRVNSYTMKSTPGIFRTGFYAVSRDVNCGFLLASLYYALVSEFHFPNLGIRMPAMKARGLILLVQYAIFLLQVFLPHRDLPQEFSKGCLQILLIRPIINPDDLCSKKDEEVEEVGVVSPSLQDYTQDNISSVGDSIHNSNSNKRLSTTIESIEVKKRR